MMMLKGLMLCMKKDKVQQQMLEVIPIIIVILIAIVFLVATP